MKPSFKFPKIAEVSVVSSPGTVQKFDLSQSFGNHGGKDEADENAADEDVVIVVLQHIELLGGVDASLVDVQSVGHNQACGLQARWGSVDSFHPGHGLVVIDKSLGMNLNVGCVGDQILFSCVFCRELRPAGVQYGLGKGKDRSSWESNEDMATGYAAFGDGRLHGPYGGGEDVGLLQDVREVRPIQGAEVGAVVLLGAFIDF